MRNSRLGFKSLWLFFVLLLGGAASGQEQAKTQPAPHSGWNLLAVPVKDAGHGADSPDRAPATTPMRESRGRWIYVDGAPSGAAGSWILGREIESWSVDSSTAAAPGWQFFSVARATPYGELRFSRVYRWDDSKADYALLGGGDVLQPGVGYFGHQEKANVSPPVASEAKRAAETDPLEALGRAVPPLGAFVPAEVLYTPHGSASQVDVALSGFDGRTYAHVVHVVRGQGAGDQVWYHRSEKAGKAGTFESSQTGTAPGSSSSVISVSIAARENRVSIVWIERLESPEEASTDGARFRVLRTESQDSGRTFGPMEIARSNNAWKRGVDTAYDAMLGHHLVWGEANKVYYLRDLTGEASNVFDVLKRTPATEVVKYLAKYEPDDAGQCACPDCWCEESHIARHDADPEDNTATEYLFRNEESYVYEPSLHVDAKTVSIVARQKRMWDNKPVGHEAWAEMFFEPVYSETVVERLRPTRFLVGYQSTWKESYEPGDELLFLGLGIQHQYRYRGTWHEQDKIRLAQRPLVPNAWSTSTAGLEEGAPGVSPWRRDSWQDGTFQSWRLSTLAWVGTEGGDDTPSHPVIAGAPWGLVVAYEDGPSDNPNAVGSNPIQLQVSVDGGRSWSEPRRVATGYKPALAVADGGDVVVSNYEPHALDGGAISVVQSNDSATSFGGYTRLNKGPAKPIHWKSHGRGADALVGGGSLGAFEDLFFAAWIEQSDQREARDRIVFSRASRASEVARYGVDLPEYVTEGRAAQVRVTAENKYHMRVASNARLQLTNLAGGPAPGGPKHAPTSVAAPLAPPATSPRTISLVGGEASLPLDLFDGAVVGDAGMVSLAVAAVPGVQGDAESAGVEVSVVPAFAASVHGNYQQALWLRDKLWRQGTDDDSSVGFQVEYEAVGDDKDASDGLRGIEEGQAIDSVPLASHERVWAYTQGIALAQYSRQGTKESLARARALARYLCSQAKVAPSGKKGFRDLIQGWPFSWNTLDDNWRDVRLVTGATAWVTHGLGVFVVSEAFSGLSEDEQKRIRACYRQALHGLIGHRHSGSMEDGRRISLVTAGWTTLGLAHADDPSALLQTGWRRTEDHLAGETWHYYDVLDALGYDDFDETRAPAVRRTMEGGHSPSSLPPLVLTKRDFAHLKQEVEATNIVTEHNLDVLSVLNHALNHQEALSLQEPGRPELSTIRAWRDELRAGIFHVLWDDVEDHWRHDLENAALSEGAGARKRTEIQAALVRGDWGRVATGGVLASESEHKEAVDAVLIDDGFFRGRFTVIPNRRHTAIDNCSWLSLSVDFDDLTNVDEVEQLARCLEFTTLAFAKDIEFEGQRYYGAHYFFDGFEDKYIEGTSRQEQSFHLEATTGLILGLLAFVEAHPEHPKRDFFVREAYALWAGVQAFVLDHGFPYSSQRIINLSTLLTSSTALIWFIDVYEHFERLGPAVTENNPWLEAHPSCEARYGIGCPPPPTKLSSTEENPTSGFLLRTLGDEALLTEVSDDSIELDLPQFVELEEDPNLLWLLTQDSNAVARSREPISLHDIDDQRVVVLRLSKEEGATGVDVVRTYNLTILGGGPFSQVPSGYRDTSFELRHIAENSTKIRVQCRNLHAGLPLELGGPGTVRMPEGVGGSVMVEAPGPDPSDAVEGATLVSLHCRLEVTGPADEHVYLGFNHLQVNKRSSALAGPSDDVPCVGHCDVVEQNPVLRAAIIAMGYFTSANCHRWKDHYLAGFKDRFPNLRVSMQQPFELCGFGLDSLMIFFDRQSITIYALDENEVYRVAKQAALIETSWENGEPQVALALAPAVGTALHGVLTESEGPTPFGEPREVPESVEVRRMEWDEAASSEEGLLEETTPSLVVEPADNVHLTPWSTGRYPTQTYTLSNALSEPVVVEIWSPDTFLLVERPRVLLGPHGGTEPVVISVDDEALVKAGATDFAIAELYFTVDGQDVDSRLVQVMQAQAITAPNYYGEVILDFEDPSQDPDWTTPAGAPNQPSGDIRYEQINGSRALVFDHPAIRAEQDFPEGVVDNQVLHAMLPAVEGEFRALSIEISTVHDLGLGSLVTVDRTRGRHSHERAKGLVVSHSCTRFVMAPANLLSDIRIYFYAPPGSRRGGERGYYAIDNIIGYRAGVPRPESGKSCDAFRVFVGVENVNTRIEEPKAQEFDSAIPPRTTIAPEKDDSKQDAGDAPPERQVIVDFEEPADDLDWWTPEGKPGQPRGDIRYERINGSRALVFDHSAIRAKEDFPEGTIDNQALHAVLPAVEGEFRALSIDISAVHDIGLGSVATVSRTQGRHSQEHARDLVMRHSCTRFVIAPANLLSDIHIYFHAPPGSMPGGERGYYAIDNIVGYPSGVPPPESGQPCASTSSQGRRQR